MKMLGAMAFWVVFEYFLFSERILKREPDKRMKFRRTNKVGKFEVKKVTNKGAVNKIVVRVAISPRSPLPKKGLSEKVELPFPDWATSS